MSDTTPAHVASALRAVEPSLPVGAPETVRSVVDATARLFFLRSEDIVGPSRARRVVEARQVAMTVIRSRTTLSLPGIAGIFARDHTTVHHAIDRVLAVPEMTRWAAAVDAAVANQPSPRPAAAAAAGPRRQCSRTIASVSVSPDSEEHT